jgi:hypothetical protein
MPHSSSTSISRRTMLRTAAAAGLCAALPESLLRRCPAAGGSDLPSAITGYLESLSRPDGGYVWEDQQQSHLTPTFAVIGCYRALKQQPPRQAELAAFVRTHHPAQLKKLEQEHREFEYQQIQGLLWLGEDASAFRDQVRGWRSPSRYLPQYEQHGYPIFRFELAAFTCRSLLGLPLDDLSPALIEYLNSRRRGNGSYNNTPVADGGDGHVLNTWWGLRALQILGRSKELRPETVAWLQACQLPDGGFTYQPQATFGAVSDAVYTWAAVHALNLLEAEPAKRDACVQYLCSLWNADGGFGGRPGWPSNPLASYYVLDALTTLGAFGRMTQARRQPARPRKSLPTDLNVYSIQIEAHGQGSPAEAVDLAAALRIHMWGAKNATPEWIASAQSIADQRRVPVKLFIANEEYGTWVNVPGFGTYSHTSDVIVPAGANFGPSLASRGVVSWPEFRQLRLAPLQQAQGRLIWQFGENEELVRIYLDDSLQRGGYAAISTFHFGNPDFTNSEPFLQYYREQIPSIALQDAHGSEPWWFADMTTGFRTLFLAREPSWEAWLEALRQNWVVAVRHDAPSGFKTWMHGGSPPVIETVCRKARDWQWWDNPAIQRPLVSLVALTPQDEFEAGRPPQGIAIRVRCAWENTTQGLPKKPLAELVKLRVDGKDVAPTLVAPRRTNSTVLRDHFHVYQLPTPTPGKHTAEAVVRVIETNAESRRTIEFHV